MTQGSVWIAFPYIRTVKFFLYKCDMKMLCGKRMSKYEMKLELRCAVLKE